MATDGPTPPPCRSDIFSDGETICLVYGPSNAIEQWVKTIAEIAGADMDWYYVGGRGNVLYLGDEETRRRILIAIKANMPIDPVGLLNI